MIILYESPLSDQRLVMGARRLVIGNTQTPAANRVPPLT